MTVVEELGSLLHHCSKTKTLRNGLPFHAIAVKAGFLSNTFFSNHLLNMYAKCLDMSGAHKVFEEMPDRNLVTWSAMISGYDQANEPSMALQLFSRMQLTPNEYVYSSAISTCASLSALASGRQIHAHSLKFGYETISFVSNSLVSLYMSCGLCNDAFTVFSCTAQPNSIAYNAMITGCADNMLLGKGLELFKNMCQHSLLPDRFSFAGAFSICTTMQNLQGGKELHCLAVKVGLDVHPFVGNTILAMYTKCNFINEAILAFESIEEKDVISWNTLIAACSHCEDHAKALRVLVEMEKANVRPDNFTLTSALAACAGLASVHFGRQIHSQLTRSMLNLDVGVGNALLNMYAKCGCIERASRVFELMPSRNLVSWNTMLVGFGNNGDGTRAIETFEQMKVEGIVPDSITFIGLLASCNHAGLVNEGCAYFNSMEATYGIIPNIEHLSCLVDMLGRAGRLEEAEKYLKSFPFGADSVVWGSLLSACRLHGEITTGEGVAGQLLELLPETSSPYVLLSNLYAADGRWGRVAEARKLLKESGVKKEPGHSLIQASGMVEKFKVGDLSHPKIKEIKEALESLSWAVGVHAL